MKYIKRLSLKDKTLNIDFNNWENIDDRNDDFNIPDDFVDDYYRFISFLNKNNVYDKFIDNLKNPILNKGFIWLERTDNYKKFLTVLHPTNWINYSFNWSKSKDGENFWLDLDVKWVNLLVENRNRNNRNRNRF